MSALNNINLSYRYSIIPSYVKGKIDIFDQLKIRGFRAYRYIRALAALDELFERYLDKNQTVTIFTASRSRYVSSCLTNAIERVDGKWSRTFEEDTYIVIAVHEWGFLCSELTAVKKECRRRGIILIEDYAYATGLFFDLQPRIHGDFVVLSLQKFFGSPMDGILLAPKTFLPIHGKALMQRQIMTQPSMSLKEKRIQVWRWYAKELGLCFEDLSIAHTGNFGVFLIPCAGKCEYLRLKMREQGVEVVYWYGNHCLLLPSHHQLRHLDVIKICVILRGSLTKDHKSSFTFLPYR